MTLLPVLLAVAAFAGPWTDTTTDARIGFTPDWTVTQGGELLPGQLMQAVHGPTGGGLIVRAQPTSAILDLPERVLNRVGDVEAGMAADRYAMVVALSQEDEALMERTLYLGLSDVVGARVGRWVFVQPATDTEPERVWWHATWRSRSHFLEAIAWVPTERISVFAAAMRTVEGGLGSLSGWQPGAALLYRTPAPSCKGHAAADRMSAVASTPQFGAAKRAIRGMDADPSVRTLAELRAVGTFLTVADTCVRQMAPTVQACQVHERRSETQRSHDLQIALIRCLEASEQVTAAVEGLTP